MTNRIWFDTEFIEDGRTIDLLSIGLVKEDGSTYYAEPAETDRSRASEWVQANVLPHLTGPVKPRAVIAEEVRQFAGLNPEFWAYYADYDWVVLCQLFGSMIALPGGWPMFCRDLRQVCAEAGITALPPQTSTEHNALNDAIWTMEAHAYVISQEASASVREPALVQYRCRLKGQPDYCWTDWREGAPSYSDDWISRHEVQTRALYTYPAPQAPAPEAPAEVAGMEPQGCPMPGACSCPTPAPQAAVRVKPLEWPLGTPSPVAHAGFRVCYGIEAIWDNDVLAHVRLMGSKNGQFPTVLEAKAAAQTDYERRVLSALDLSTIPEQARPEAPVCTYEDGVRVARDVLAERRRQVEAEGWTPEHDDVHADGAIAKAAACYAMSSTEYPKFRGNNISWWWPWDAMYWKPKDRRSDLVRAGALIIAEIERLDRAASQSLIKGEGE